LSLEGWGVRMEICNRGQGNKKVERGKKDLEKKNSGRLWGLLKLGIARLVKKERSRSPHSRAEEKKMRGNGGDSKKKGATGDRSGKTMSGDQKPG